MDSVFANEKRTYGETYHKLPGEVFGRNEMPHKRLIPLRR